MDRTGQDNSGHGDGKFCKIDHHGHLCHELTHSTTSREPDLWRVVGGFTCYSHLSAPISIYWKRMFEHEKCEWVASGRWDAMEWNGTDTLYSLAKKQESGEEGNEARLCLSWWRHFWLKSGDGIGQPTPPC